MGKSKSRAHLKMRIYGLVFAAVSADLCSDGSQCKADGQCKLNNRDPCFGGHCWENFNKLEWAEKNCQGDWQSKYPDPGPTTEWISLGDFQAQHPAFDPDILIGRRSFLTCQLNMTPLLTAAKRLLTADEPSVTVTLPCQTIGSRLQAIKEQVTTSRILTSATMTIVQRLTI